MEMFESTMRSAGDLAGVFEFDEDAGYFYLYEVVGPEGGRVVDAIHIISGDPDFGPKDLIVRWEATETKVGLFIRNQLWAAFDLLSSVKFGGGYRSGGLPRVPPEVAEAFVMQ